MTDTKVVIHPALTVNNIKSFIPITLETDKLDYASWAELSKIYAKVYQVLDHIIPSKEGVTAAPKSRRILNFGNDSTRSYFDGCMGPFLWTFFTPFFNVVQRPTKHGHVWKNIFLDNKGSRVVILEQRFSAIKLRDFPNMTAYCQRLKTLSDQLSSVDPLVEHSNPIPPFEQARFTLLLA